MRCRTYELAELVVELSRQLRRGEVLNHLDDLVTLVRPDLKVDEAVTSDRGRIDLAASSPRWRGCGNRWADPQFLFWASGWLPNLSKCAPWKIVTAIWSE